MPAVLSLVTELPRGTVKAMRALGIRLSSCWAGHTRSAVRRDMARPNIQATLTAGEGRRRVDLCPSATHLVALKWLWYSRNISCIAARPSEQARVILRVSRAVGCVESVRVHVASGVSVGTYVAVRCRATHWIVHKCARPVSAGRRLAGVLRGGPERAVASGIARVQIRCPIRGADLGERTVLQLHRLARFKDRRKEWRVRADTRSRTSHLATKLVVRVVDTRIPKVDGSTCGRSKRDAAVRAVRIARIRRCVLAIQC